MIKYSLKCTSKDCNELPFDGWFKNIDAFENQKKSGLLICPHCGSSKIVKSLMSPSINSSKKSLRNSKPEFSESKIGLNLSKNEKNLDMNQVFTLLRKMKKEIQKKGDFVGDKFVEEVRSINSGVSKERTVYGHAEPEQIEELLDEGIDVAAIPWIQDDH